MDGPAAPGIGGGGMVRCGDLYMNFDAYINTFTRAFAKFYDAFWVGKGGRSLPSRSPGSAQPGKGGCRRWREIVTKVTLF